jgi:hypothetical protein
MTRRDVAVFLTCLILGAWIMLAMGRVAAIVWPVDSPPVSFVYYYVTSDCKETGK